MDVCPFLFRQLRLSHLTRRLLLVGYKSCRRPPSPKYTFALKMATSEISETLVNLQHSTTRLILESPPPHFTPPRWRAVPSHQLWIPPGRSCMTLDVGHPAPTRILSAVLVQCCQFSRWAEYAARMGEMRNACQVFVESEKSRVRPGCRWEHGMKCLESKKGFWMW